MKQISVSVASATTTVLDLDRREASDHTDLDMREAVHVEVVEDDGTTSEYPGWPDDRPEVRETWDAEIPEVEWRNL